jgi:hypothetical protein
MGRRKIERSNAHWDRFRREGITSAKQARVKLYILDSQRYADDCRRDRHFLRPARY